LTARPFAAVLVVAIAIGGCGDDSQPAPAGKATVDLSITASDGRGKTRRARLRCEGEQRHASGFVDANARELCRSAQRLERFLASEPDPRRACTQIYGGPETARITGTIEGSAVDRRLSRTDGCRISDWERAAALIPLGPR
jgi:hypothetical protein